MMKPFKKQRGLSLFETMLAVMLVGGVIAILMNVESGSKSSENTTILAQDISLLLNKTLAKTLSAPSTDANGNLSPAVSTGNENLAQYLSISTSFVYSLTARGLKSFSLNIKNGAKDSGSMNNGYAHHDSCNALDVVIWNKSNLTWMFDSTLSSLNSGASYNTDHGSSTDTPIKPGEIRNIIYSNHDGWIRAHLYFRSEKDDIVGYYIEKEHDNNEDSESRHAKVDSYVKQGWSFTAHGHQDTDALCSGEGNDQDRNGEADFIIFDPATQIAHVTIEFSSVKQAKIISSNSYRVLDEQYLSRLTSKHNPPLSMSLDSNNPKEIIYDFYEICPLGALNDGYETPYACAYQDLYA